MTSRRLLWMGILPALLLILGAGLASGFEAGHVVLVSIDGFAAYHLDNMELALPNIRELAAEGAQAASSETVFPSVTHPSHTTLITGVAPGSTGFSPTGCATAQPESHSTSPTNSDRSPSRSRRFSTLPNAKD